MTNRQRRQLESLVSALHHLENAEFDDPRFMTYRTDLASSIARISRLSTDQTNAAVARSDRTRRIARQKRELRVRHLLPIAHRGKRLLNGMPGIKEELRVPHPRVPEEKLLAAAARIIKTVRPYEAELIAAGAPSDFLPQTGQAALKLEQLLADPARDTSAQTIATRAIRTELAAARTLILAIGAEIRSRFFDRPGAIELWASVTRVRERMGRPPTSSGTPVPKRKVSEAPASA